MLWRKIHIILNEDSMKVKDGRMSLGKMYGFLGDNGTGRRTLIKNIFQAMNSDSSKVLLPEFSVGYTAMENMKAAVYFSLFSTAFSYSALLA